MQKQTTIQILHREVSASTANSAEPNQTSDSASSVLATLFAEVPVMRRLACVGYITLRENWKLNFRIKLRCIHITLL